MSSPTDQPLPFLYQLTAGAIAGVSECVITYPTDVAKSRLQLQVAGVGEQYKGMVDCLTKIVRNEGFWRLYRGIQLPIIIEAPKRATKFAANESWGNFYRKLFDSPMNQSMSILTGATAGATEGLVVTSAELLKIRLQDKSLAAKYKGPIDVIVKVIREEGPLALFNGLEATVWRHITWNAAYFGSIFQLRSLAAQWTGRKPGQKPGVFESLCVGTIAGSLGTLVNIPFDVVKSRVQVTAKVPGVVPKYNWAWPALFTIAREEGAAALYKGLIPKLIRLGPGGGILLVVFSQVSDFFRARLYPPTISPL